MLGQSDQAVFHFINSVLANNIFDRLMPLVTKLGSGELIFILAVLVIIFGGPEKRMGGILLLAGLTAGYFVIEFLKVNVAMPRPFISMSDVRLLVPRPGGFSFPSGHSLDAFMAAAIMTKFFKKGWFWYSLAVLTAFSRVYIGAHYASDVLAGAVLGIIIGYILVRAAGRSKAS